MTDDVLDLTVTIRPNMQIVRVRDALREHWPGIDLDSVKLVRIPPGHDSWDVPMRRQWLMDDDGKPVYGTFDTETIYLHQLFLVISVRMLHVGYSSRSKTLVWWIE